jgi:signal-transduction protein with cAMP-binding, CBS, and nucleotidyltransferase domain
MVVNVERDFGSSISVEEIHNGILVKEIMSKDVFVIDADASILMVAKKMLDHDIGSIIITRDGESVGIITERDILFKTVVKNILPGDMRCKDIMSSPIISTKPSMGIIEAMELMVKCDIRRLAVIEDGCIVGIVTDKDIMYLAPGLNTILESLIELHRTDNPIDKSESERGICQRCGALSEELVYQNGRMMCEDCREDEGYYD